MLRIVGLLLVSLTALAGCSSGATDDGKAGRPGSATAGETSALPSIAYYYQPIRTPADIAKLGDVTGVVTTSNFNRDAEVVEAFRDFEAQEGRQVDAYRYFQTYWYPHGRMIDGLDMAEHPDWAFCLEPGHPTLGKTDANGDDWYYLNFNEKAVRAFILQQLKRLKAEGYDGIFLDRGLAAFTGNSIGEHPEVWFHSSTCTDDPHLTEPGQDTFSDAFAAMLSLVHEADLKLILNYGYSPRDEAFPLRPDPRDPECRERKFTTCTTIEDSLDSVDYFLDEAVTHPEDTRWERDFIANLANEQDPVFGGRVIGLVTDGQLAHDTSPRAVHFAFARARLFDFPVTVFTGDDNCQGIVSPDLCNRAGVYPRLNSAQFGTPLAEAPVATRCEQGSRERCVWYRTYADGVSIVNVTPRRQTVTIDLPEGPCRHVTSLVTGKPYGGDRCHQRLQVTLQPWSGLPLLHAPAGDER